MTHEERKLAMRVRFIRRLKATNIAERAIFVVAFAAITGTLIIAVHAATSSGVVSAYPQKGTLSGNATLVTDPTAVDGQAVKFGSSSGSAGGGSGSSGSPHIMVFMMENQSYSDIIGSSDAPYMNALSKSYETATDSYGVGHDSLDNYLAALSGNFYSWSIDDCDPGSGCQTSATTLSNQLDSANIPWDAYMQSMPSNCYSSDAGGSGGYAVRHDPFVYFTNVASSDCSKVQPDTGMISALNSSSAPDFVWYSPNICNDAGGDAGCATISAGDTFVKSEIPAIQATAWYKNGGVIVLTFDEGDNSGQATGEYLTGEGNHVLTIIVSAATAGKTSYTSYVNIFGLLAGIEKAYGQSCLGQACTSSSGVMPL